MPDIQTNQDVNFNQFFRAKLIEKSQPEAGPFAGLWTYAWEQAYFDPATGVSTVVQPCRSGTLTENPALELNNVELEVTADIKPIVFLRTKGFVGDKLVYEFSETGAGILPPPPPPPPPTTCSGCGWVAGLGVTDCLKMTIIDAGGSCSCVATGQTLKLHKVGGVWVPKALCNDPNSVDTCTHTVSVVFDPNPCGPPCLKFTTTDGGSGGEYTNLLSFDCCRSNEAYFNGGGPLHCSGMTAAGGPAGNTFWIAARSIRWGR